MRSSFSRTVLCSAFLLASSAGSTFAGLTPWIVGGNTGLLGTPSLGTTDNQQLILIANGSQGLRMNTITTALSGGGPSVTGMYIAGGLAQSHTVATSAPGSTIFGGINIGGNNVANAVYDICCTVSGGGGNSAGSSDATSDNAWFATIGGGSGNTAGAGYSTVNGGSANNASGQFSSVPGGIGNSAGGDSSFAAGTMATVRDAAMVGGKDTNGDQGTFVWADSTTNEKNPFVSSGPNQFLVRATGGIGFNTNTPRGGFEIQYDSNSSRPQLTLTEVGGDFTRLNFRNTVTNRFFSIASFTAGAIQAQDRFNFYHNAGGNMITCTGDGRIGIGTTNPGLFRLDVNGAVRCTALVQTSSARYKTDVQGVGNVLDRFMQLRPVAFTWDKDHGGERDLGLIAEEVAELFPEAVAHSEGKVEGINYARLTALAVQAMKEGREQETKDLAQLREENEQLKARLDRLEKLVK